MSDKNSDAYVPKFDSVIISYGNDITVARPDGSSYIHYEKRGTAAFSYSYVQSLIRKIAGKVLTVVDASLTNEKQLKAVKDIIRNQIAEELGQLWEASEQNHEKIIEDSVNALPEDYFEKETPENSATLEEVVGA